MHLKKLTPAILAVMLLASPVLAGSAGNGGSGAPSMQMAFPSMESVYHDPTGKSYITIDPYGKVNALQYADVITALGKLRILARQGKITSQATFDSELAKLGLANAKTGMTAMAIDFTNFVNVIIKPMYARNTDGTIRDIVAIDNSKPINAPSHQEQTTVVVTCPSEYVYIYLPACSYCYGWNGYLTEAQFLAAWSSGAISSDGAGGRGAQPTYCCTPQAAGQMSVTPPGPCYGTSTKTVYDPATVSIIRWPAQLVPINGEMVWVVQTPANQIGLGGINLGANNFVTGTSLETAQNKSATSITMPVNPATGAMTNASGSAPSVTDKNAGTAKPNPYTQNPPKAH